MNNQQAATLFRGPIKAADGSYVQGERPDLNMLFNAYFELSDIAYDEEKPISSEAQKIYEQFTRDIIIDFRRVVFDFFPVTQEEVFVKPEDVFRECFLTIWETGWTAEAQETVKQIKKLLLNTSAELPLGKT